MILSPIAAYFSFNILPPAKGLVNLGCRLQEQTYKFCYYFEIIPENSGGYYEKHETLTRQQMMLIQNLKGQPRTATRVKANCHSRPYRESILNTQISLYYHDEFPAEFTLRETNALE